MLPELMAVLTVVGRESFHEIKDEWTISYITKSQWFVFYFLFVIRRVRVSAYKLLARKYDVYI